MDWTIVEHSIQRTNRMIALKTGERDMKQYWSIKTSS